MINKITDDYCSFEVSKLLKEKGFSWNSYTLVNKDGRLAFENTTGTSRTMDDQYPCYNEDGKQIRPNKYTETNKHYPRPTHNLAIKWIRFNFGYQINSNSDVVGLWYYCIQNIIPSEKNPRITQQGELSNDDYASPEEAIEAGLIYTLKNLM